MNVRAARLTTQALAATCGVLLLLLVAQYAGLGRGYHWDAASADGEDAKALPNIDQRAPQMPAAGAFAAIDAHPLFNEDRAPSPQEGAAADDAAPPSNPLNVQLTGVIIDEVSHVRVAMLLDKARNLPVSLKVGMPLEGDQAAWTLVDVKPRVAVFRNATAETSEVELETSTAAAKAPQPKPVAGRSPTGRPVAAPPGTPPVGTAPAPPPTSAGGDLAKRIEERRRQMREDAERNRNGPPPSGSDKNKK